MKTIVKFISVLSIFIFIAGSIYASQRDPVAVLFQVKGNVEYSKDGEKWKKVRRNKFLFAGYQVRSAADGSGKITIKATGSNMILEPSTVLEVTPYDLSVVKGDLNETEKSNVLVSGLVKRFSKSQSYTTVRRSANTRELDAARSVVLSSDHPYMVWDNLDREYSYDLIVGNDVYEIPPVKDDVVQARINPFIGTKEFVIKAKKDGKVVAELEPYRSRGEEMRHSISWLDKSQEEELNGVISGLTDEYGEDTFILGTYYEKVDMWVAAMTQYRKYLMENPDDIEMTPYLFRVYKKLKLDSIYQKELNQWTQAMAQ